MSRNPTRLLVALTLLALVFLSPTLATAFPQGATLHSAAERPEPTPGLVAKLWDLLSAVWSTGSILDPDGADASSGIEPNAASTTDTGSILEPNG